MLQGGEIIIILLIALVVLGPTRLPELARKAGRIASELRQAARDVTSGLEAEVQELREVRDELRGQVDDLKKPMRDLQDEARAADPRNYDWKGPKPVSGPTPEDAMKDLEEIERRQSESPDPDERDQDSR